MKLNQLNKTARRGILRVNHSFAIMKLVTIRPRLQYKVPTSLLTDFLKVPAL